MLNILGMGCFHPSTVIDNKFIEDLNVGTSSEWIMDKIGVETRVTTLPLDYIRDTRNQDTRLAASVSSHTAADLGAEACERALECAGISPEDVGLFICNCCTPSHLGPSTSQQIAGVLGVMAPSYEVLTACPAFALHLDYLSNFKEEALPDYILCVSTATLTHHVNYNDRSDGAIWGDGAAAWVVSPRKDGKLKVVSTLYTTDPSRCEAVVIDLFGFFRQDGRAVRDFSVRQTVRLIKALEESYGVDWNKDIFVGHQANATMLGQITNNRGIPDTNHWHNVRYVGNQAAAGAPAVMAQHWDKIQSGQKIVVAVVGAGLSWGSVLMEAR